MINENNYVDKAEEAIIKLRSKVNKKQANPNRW